MGTHSLRGPEVVRGWEAQQGGVRSFLITAQENSPSRALPWALSSSVELGATARSSWPPSPPPPSTPACPPEPAEAPKASQPQRCHLPPTGGAQASTGRLLCGDLVRGCRPVCQTDQRTCCRAGLSSPYGLPQREGWAACRPCAAWPSRWSQAVFTLPGVLGVVFWSCRESGWAGAPSGACSLVHGRPRRRKATSV